MVYNFLLLLRTKTPNVSLPPLSHPQTSSQGVAGSGSRIRIQPLHYVLRRAGIAHPPGHGDERRTRRRTRTRTRGQDPEACDRDRRRRGRRVRACRRRGQASPSPRRRCFNKIVHPLITTTAVCLTIAKGVGGITDTAFADVIRSYKVGNVNTMAMGR